ncbi:uncharacterized protein [Dendrobates tinctorius]|uniref:uncharacterized protein n=1 Tax=Dendrobates tinctorius TaxID=92724 RepID=UPI003CCA5668
MTLEAFGRLSRMPMTCPVCYKVTTLLAKHLKRQCCKFDTDEQRKATLATARQNLIKIASKGGTIKYEDILSLRSLETVVTFLEDRGYLVVNKPVVARTVQDEETHRPCTSIEQAPTEESPAHSEGMFQGEVPTVVPSGVEESQATLDPKDCDDRLENEEPIGSTQVREIGKRALQEEVPPAIATNVEGSTAPVHSENRLENEDISSNIADLNNSESESCDRSIADPVDASEDVSVDPVQAPVDHTEETDDSTASAQMESEDEEEPSTLDLQTQKVMQTKWTTDIRKKMKTAGLYKRHSLSDPILQSFAYYLHRTLSVQNYKQEVENIARFLYYMDPQRVTLNFVLDIPKSISFLTKLQDIKLTSQTVFNYLKHLKRFVHHQLRASNLAHEDRDLYNSFKIFEGVTKDIQTRLSKGISKEVVGKRYRALNSLTMNAVEAQKILDVAKPEFLRCIRNVCNGSKDTEQHLQILYYLECLLVLKHAQRPGVVQHMTASNHLL